MTTTSARERAFVAHLERDGTILAKVAGAYCRSASDRDDLMQDMTVALWTAFPRYDERLRFATWMYRVVLNVAVSFYRSERRRSAAIARDDVTKLDAAAPIDDPNDRVLALIASLAELDTALMLLHLDGYSYDEIAGLVGLTTTNVATKLHRLKQRAQRALETTAITEEFT